MGEKMNRDEKKDAATSYIERLKKLNNARGEHDCRDCIHDGNQCRFPSGCTGCCVDGKMNNFILKTEQENER